MSRSSRYIQDVAPDEAADLMAGAWLGEEDGEDGLSLQTESLELREDGTFSHSLSHQLVTGNPSSSSASGHWRLHSVRFLGQDVDAEGDREISFQAYKTLSGGPGARPLVERLVVCGTNPRVNGFIGVACRLYPADRARPSNQRAAAADVDEPEDIEDVSDEAVAQVVDVTGHGEDACRAALLQSRGSVEESVMLLLEASGDFAEAAPAPAPPPPPADARELRAQAARLAEATGRTQAACEAALRASWEAGARDLAEAADSALDGLLEGDDDPPPPPRRAAAAEAAPAGGREVRRSLRAAEAGPAPAAELRRVRGTGSPSRGLRAWPGDDVDRVQAVRLAEATGQKLEVCMEALRSADGRADAAAASLLGLEAAEAASPAEAAAVDDADARAGDESVSSASEVGQPPRDDAEDLEAADSAQGAEGADDDEEFDATQPADFTDPPDAFAGVAATDTAATLARIGVDRLDPDPRDGDVARGAAAERVELALDELAPGAEAEVPEAKRRRVLAPVEDEP